MTKQEIQDTAAKLCGVLSELAFEYEVVNSSRSDQKSCYVYVRRPRYLEIRISDHVGRHRKKHFDIGPHGITLEQAIAELREWR